MKHRISRDSLRSYKTYFPLKRQGTNRKRSLCFVKENIESKQRSDLWIKSSKLSSFADDTQSIIISNNIEEAMEIMMREANSVINLLKVIT